MTPPHPFDLETTRRRLGNDEALLRALLRSFRQFACDWPAEFAAARAQGDHDAGVRLAHTLKGAAANVGAVQVQATAAMLEAALVAAAEPARVDGRVADCLAALETARAALDDDGPAETGAGGAGR